MSAALTSVTFASAAVVGGLGAFLLFDQLSRGSSISSGDGLMGLILFGVGSALATSGDCPG
jgi:hypothetical protein